MNNKNWITLKTASGKTRLDVNSIIAMTKAYDTFGETQWDLHMISGTIFSINEDEYNILMNKMVENAKPKYPGYSGNYPPSHSYGLRPWSEEE